MGGWPWPGDGPADRAKRVALSYRHLLVQIVGGDVFDPSLALEALDGRWAELGAGWVKPTDSPLRLDDWLTAQEMADLFHISAKQVYMWGYRSHIEVIESNGEKRYRVGDVVDYERQRRGRRHTSAVACQQ